MIGYDEALSIIFSEAGTLAAECCAIERAVGRILSSPVLSPTNLPPFDNTAMDGFALRCGSGPLAAGYELDVQGAQAAGDGRVRNAVGAWEIMTGARLPEGLDTVVPVEQVEVLAQDAAARPRRIRLLAEVKAGQHIRRAGEDVAYSQCVIATGERLQAPQAMLLAALGVKEVRVARRPRVALIATGRELVDDPAIPLGEGQIRNCNSPFLAIRLAAAGADVVYRETVGDVPELFLAALSRALAAGAEVVLSTGAVSMGCYDFVPDALASIGAQTRFHKVKIRPGKPLLFARLNGGQLYFGLPGNPVSSAVGLRFFVEPALRAMLGLAPEIPLRVPLAAPVNKSPGFRLHLKARLEIDPQSRAQVVVLKGQESFRIFPLLQANAWAVLPEEAAALAAGSSVEVYGPGHLEPSFLAK